MTRTGKVLTIAALAATALSLSACKEIQKALEPPKPVSLVFMLDSSSSFSMHRDPAIRVVRSLSNSLEPDVDKLRAFRIAGEVHWLYSGEKTSGKKFSQVLDSYVRVERRDRGTAYGAAFTRGLQELKDLSARSDKTALVILGDGKDERARDANMDWKRVPRTYASLPSNAKVFFLFLEPREANRYREAFKPIVGDRFEPFTPVESENGSAEKKILAFLSRS
jgi:hypothetical protein